MKWILAMLMASLPAMAHAEDASLPKAKFVSEFQEKAPAHFCKEGTYFAKCFSVEAKACQEQVKKDVETCAKDLDTRLPAEFHQPADGQTWGKEIGSCMGEKLETAFQDKKNDSADCKDSSHWQ